VVSVTTRFIV
jgi:hypothetical protein